MEWHNANVNLTRFDKACIRHSYARVLSPGSTNFFFFSDPGGGKGWERLGKYFICKRVRLRVFDETGLQWFRSWFRAPSSWGGVFATNSMRGIQSSRRWQVELSSYHFGGYFPLVFVPPWGLSTFFFFFIFIFSSRDSRWVSVMLLTLVLCRIMRTIQ